MSPADTIRLFLYAGLALFVGRIVWKVVYDCTKDVRRK